VEETRQKRAHNRVFRLEIVCQGCGITVVGSSGKRKYCSRQCGNKHRAAEIAAYHREYHKANREKKNARSHRFREERPDKDWHIAYYRENKEKILRRGTAYRAKSVGLSVEQYDSELAARNGLCDICGQPQRPTKTGKIRTLSLDHDHATNKFRGFLCAPCNTALGGFRDNPETMRTAALYIERSRGY